MPRQQPHRGPDPAEHAEAHVLVVGAASSERVRRAFRRRGHLAARMAPEEAADAVIAGTDAVVIAATRRDALAVCGRLKARHQIPWLPVLVLARRPAHPAWDTAAPDAWLAPAAPLREIVGRTEELVHLRRATKAPARLSRALAELAAENGQLYDRARRDAEGTLRLLRELQHRVRNNLATMQALLVLERHRTPPRPLGDALDAAIGRLHSLGAMQELSASGSAPARVGELVSRLAAGIQQLVAEAGCVPCEVEGDAEIRAESAGPLGVVLHELLANALVRSSARRVVVRIRTGPAGVRIDVEDDGRGIPVAPHAGSGLTIARTVACNELHGELAAQPLERGTRVRLVLPPDVTGSGGRYAACALPPGHTGSQAHAERASAMRTPSLTSAGQPRARGAFPGPPADHYQREETMSDPRLPEAASAPERAHGTHGSGDTREELDAPAPVRPGNEREEAGRRISPRDAGELADAGWGSSASGGSVSDKRAPDTP